MSFDSLLNTAVTITIPVLSMGPLREQIVTQSVAYSGVPARIAQGTGRAQFGPQRRESKATHQLFCRFPGSVGPTILDLQGGTVTDSSTTHKYQIVQVGNAAGQNHHMEALLEWLPEGVTGP